MLKHGGKLLQAVHDYDIPLDDWLDLSTGINPNGWPVPELPSDCWNRLPQNEDDLIVAARKYYQTDVLLAVAGSQAAIQVLPQLRKRLYHKSRIGLISPSYNEHAHAWEMAGHDVVILGKEDIDKSLENIDVLLLVNPNNPSGCLFEKTQLFDWHKKLQHKNGWLVIDEAFMDCSNEQSLLSHCPLRGLIVLASLGKFFGLAGARVGFVFAEKTILSAIENILGPWTIAGPSRFVATLALLDRQWQENSRLNLKKQSKRLTGLMLEHGLIPDGGTFLFQWLRHKHAYEIFECLAKQGIFIRYFKASSSIRFGLPKKEFEWVQLQSALIKLNQSLENRQR